MDTHTLQVYAANAASLCADYRAVQPTELHHTVLGFFHAGEATADIGCGCGRDVAWLSAEFGAASPAPSGRQTGACTRPCQPGN